MDRGAWQATAHGAAKSQTRLKQQHAHSSAHITQQNKTISKLYTGHRINSKLPALTEP